MSGAAVVEVERTEHVVTITLNRPEARNAVNYELAAGICDAVRESQDARAIVVTGADPAFCAGLDLRSLGVEGLGELPPFVATVAGSAVPVIAAVNGPAVTGGFEIALAADFIVASERASFADTHLRVGVYPGPVLVDLPRRVGEAWAKEISLTGNFVDATTALSIGIANHVVAHEELLPFARTLAGAIAEQDPEMVRVMREDFAATVGTPLEEARRTHLGHMGKLRGRARPTAATIAARRETVLDRSRRQRGTDGA